MYSWKQEHSKSKRKMKYFYEITNKGKVVSSHFTIQECIRPLNELLKHDFVTVDVLKNYFTRKKLKHDRYFRDIDITRRRLILPRNFKKIGYVSSECEMVLVGKKKYLLLGLDLHN